MPFLMIRNDITKVAADAIVNPANRNLLQGSGTSRAIYQAAGEQELTAACEAIGHCEPGRAVCTPAFGLPAKYIFHAVCPAWQGGIFLQPAPTLYGFSAPTVKLVAFIVLRYIVVVDVLLHRGEQLAADRQRVPVVEHQIHGQVVLHDVLCDGVHRNAEGLFFGVAIVPAGQQRESHALAVVLCG